MSTTNQVIQQELLLQQLITYRRELHEHPELSMKEYETTARIKNWLKEAGITVLDYGLKVGVIAEVVGDELGPTIALRADIDALPIVEATNLSFASKNDGVMHACGHDFHTASMIGTAILLQKRKSELKGTVRFIFQPAEEIAEGAKYVDHAGALNGVEAIFGMHNKPDLAVGTIGVGEGALMASVDLFKIEVIGVGGHAGIPNNSIDPIIVAGQIITALQTIVSRNLKAFDNAVISITKVHAGTAWNVIPDKAVLEGTVRIFQKDVREKVPQLMKQITEGIAAGFGATSIFKWYPSVSSVNNDGAYTAVIKETASELGYQVVDAEKSLGGEDFSYYQEKIPGYFVWLGVDGPQEWHHPSFTLKEEALLIAANYFSTLSINVLKQHAKL